MNNPLVSIITPVFNDGVYLHDSLTSSLSQTYPNFEVIICNDGSTDKLTLEYLTNINVKMNMSEQCNYRVLTKLFDDIDKCTEEYTVFL